MSEQAAIRETKDEAARVIAANPEKARVKNASATASLKDGLTLSVTGPNGEAVETDMPKGVGGEGGVPQPGWLMRAALASCTGTVIAMRAAKLGIALDKLDVTVESQSDNRGLLGLDRDVSAAMIGLHVAVRIRAANTPKDQLESLVHWGEAHSPVACTLRGALAAEIDVVME
jgi:uncharacterized OsmC-like protein